MTVQEAAFAYVGAFVDELARSGVRHVCICPGSRSTPLSMLLADHPDVRVWMHVDERSAGFFALGLAKATGEPVALVATSGTAVTNFMPAVVEAFFGRVPLLLLTADRPHEHRDIGSSQTIDQVRVYGTHVKWFVDMALPETGDTMVRYARTVASRAVATAGAAPAGPVHLNFPLREPLIPRLGLEHSPSYEREDGSPYARVIDGTRTLSMRDAAAVAGEWASVERGVIVCGPGTPADAAESLIALSRTLGWPVLADPLSGLRTGGEPNDGSMDERAEGSTDEPTQGSMDERAEGSTEEQTHSGTVQRPEDSTDGRQALAASVAASVAPAATVIDAYDVFLRYEEVVDMLAPELVIRFGAMPVSKPVLQYLQRYADVPQVVIDEGGGWRDPTLSASAVLHVAPRQLCLAVADALAGDEHFTGERARDTGDGGRSIGERGRDWIELWRRLNTVTRDTLWREVDELSDMFEGRVFQELAQLLPDGAALYVGNSMPIRDMDAFFPVVDRRIAVFGNRGVNGIDGVVSSALGAAAAVAGPLVLVLGDLSFYHDLNGLLAAKLHDLNATIVVINNDGGGIFSFLPQAQHPKHFELLFGTPIGLDFEPTVRMYGGKFTRAGDWEQFRRAVRHGLSGDGLHVVEVVTKRTRNAEQHRDVVASARAAVTGLLQPVTGTTDGAHR